MNDRFTFEKWFNLELFEKHFYDKIMASDCLKAYENKGFIYLKVQLLDLSFGDLPKIKKNPSSNIQKSPKKRKPEKLSDEVVAMLRKNLELAPIVREEVKYKDIPSKVTIYFKDNKSGDVTEEEDLYDDLSEVEEPKRKEIFDRCSNVSTSDIDGINENRIDIRRMKIGIGRRLERIELLADGRIDKIIPKDPEEMKIFIEDYAKTVNEMCQPYFKNLKTVSNINNSMKSYAKNIHNQYKELKKKFFFERLDLKYQNFLFKRDNSVSIEETKNVHSKVDDLRANFRFFTEHIGVENEPVDKEEDSQTMLAIIDNVMKNGVDVYQDLNKNERKDLENMLGRYEKDKIAIKNAIPPRLDAIIKDLVDREIIKTVAVSETYFPDTYKFDDKIVTLFVEDDVLKIRGNGRMNFEKWILQHFSLNPPIENKGGAKKAAKKPAGKAKK